MVPGVYHCGQGTGAPDANQGAEHLGPAYPVAPPYPGPVIPNHHALPTAPPIPGPLFPLGNLFGAASSSKHWKALHPPPNPLPPNFFGTTSAPKVDGKETPEIQVIDQFKLIDLANITQMSFKPITPATPAKKPLSYINTPTATGSLGISPQHPIVLTDESSPGIITSAKPTPDLSIILPSQGSSKRGLSDDWIVTGGPRKKAKISK
ncbi:hypothetical protein NUW58_g7841 [Xylaria curta]|uniref:Uncharacterized protein n=1 Tax=Xylaria curta TaxID=42375 RepID=A0ACC1NE61_9PEZI|nr:hypothetical protein NUW58_g7841 [Xylaria curta]